MKKAEAPSVQTSQKRATEVPIFFDRLLLPNLLANKKRQPNAKGYPAYPE